MKDVQEITKYLEENKKSVDMSVETNLDGEGFVVRTWFLHPTKGYMYSAEVVKPSPTKKDLKKLIEDIEKDYEKKKLDK